MCGLEKALDQFEGSRNTCKECRNQQARDSQRGRAWKYRTQYGMTLKDYDTLYPKQGGQCAICGTDTPGGPGERFRVDHNHDTGEVRGLLCNSCNRGLGYLKDSPTILSKALTYLSTNGCYDTSKSK